MRFEESPFYGARVEAAKKHEGFISTERFNELCKQEFADYRAAYPSSRGGSRLGVLFFAILALVAFFLFTKVR